MNANTVRILVIDPKKESVYAKEIPNTLEAKEEIVGGFIERAMYLSDDEELYINEEGLFGPCVDWFLFEGQVQPLTGTGYVIGFDRSNRENKSSKLDPEEIRKQIRFAHRTYIEILEEQK